jgi:hypothetical protein
MGLATFSYDVAAGASSRAAIAAAVEQQLAPITSWQLLAGLWMLDFPAIADFEAFGAALEALYAQHRGEFDYFALHFDPAGGPVMIAPNPGVRQPQPVPRTRSVAPRAPGALPRATIEVADPRRVLAELEELHASFAREARTSRPTADRKRTERRRGTARPGGRARGRGPRSAGSSGGRRPASRSRSRKRSR